MMIRLKAGVLSFTIFVSMVVSVMLLAIIIYGYYSRSENAMYRIGFRLFDNLSSAEQWALGSGDELEYGETRIWDLFGDGIDSVSVRRFPWGIFDGYYCEAFYQRFRQSSCFLVGSPFNELGLSAIYLVDEGRPLSVVGETKIEGTAYLPKAGVKSAFINRLGYTGESLIYGEVEKSDNELPELHGEETLEEFEKYVESIETVSVDEQQMIQHSFLSDTLWTAEWDQVNDSLLGFIFIENKKKVIMDSLGFTENVVVQADQIEFQSGFRGSGQFFASDTIIINSDVILNYPTVIYVKNERKPAYIEIKEKAKVNALLIMDGGSPTDRDRVIKIEDETQVNGAIYCHGYLESFGNVHGHVMAKRFLINSFSGIYENYIMNAQYQYDLDTGYLAPNAWFQSEENAIVKWLY